MTATKTAFTWMLREEWRLHAELFGGVRFAAFPLFVALMVGGAAELLVTVGTDPTTVLAGVHALVFAFGLHTGSIGFVGRDAQENLLPTGTLLVFTARTLPLSRRRLVALFLLKDAAYYAVLFMVPITLGFVPAVLDGRMVASDIPMLWASLTATFVVGTAVTFAAIALTTRGQPGWIAMLGLAAAAGILWVSEELVRFTPYALYADRTPLALVGTGVLVSVLLAFGFAVYDPTYERPARTAGNGFGRLHARLPFRDGLVTKALLDVSRSSGGLFKLVFSGGILFAVSAVLIQFAGEVTGQVPSTGISFGAILGLSAFTTYNWLTNVDSPEDYLPYPVSIANVFRAKARAFVVLGPPVGLLYYVLAVAWYGSSIPEAVTGLVLLGGLMAYQFGVTVYLTGFSPNEFLFDTLLFALFTVLIAVPVVPILVVGFVVTPVPAEFLFGLGVAGLTMGALGTTLYRRAIPRWTLVHRNGEA